MNQALGSSPAGGRRPGSQVRVLSHHLLPGPFLTEEARNGNWDLLRAKWVLCYSPSRQMFSPSLTWRLPHPNFSHALDNSALLLAAVCKQ